MAATWAAVLSGPVAHGDESWVIRTFQSDINVASDSTLTVKEDIRVDFGALQKHGIFRTIPLRYRFDDSHDRYYNLGVTSVTDGSRPVEFAVTSTSANALIKIGNPSALVARKQRHVITHSL